MGRAVIRSDLEHNDDQSQLHETHRTTERWAEDAFTDVCERPTG